MHLERAPSGENGKREGKGNGEALVDVDVEEIGKRDGRRWRKMSGEAEAPIWRMGMT